MDNKTERRKRGPKYKRWNPETNEYEFLKPYNLLKDPNDPEVRLMPLGLREQLTDTEFKAFTDFAEIKIYDEKIRKKNTTKKNKKQVSKKTSEDDKIPTKKNKTVISNQPLKIFKRKNKDINHKEERPEPEIEKGDEKQDRTEIDNEYLYPTLDDPDFNIKIAKRKEFNNTKYDGTIYNVEEKSNQLCNADFELNPHQSFVKNFLSMDTPYNSLLLYHGLGTGKTCSAIGIAEEMRKYMKKNGINKPILVIASPNVQDNFRVQLFDESKLNNKNGTWSIKKCMGNDLLKEVLSITDANRISKETIINEVNSLIKTNYVFMGYIELANFINKNVDFNETKYSKEEIELLKKQKIKKIFNDRLIIIDEAHNIRITNENNNGKTAELLMEVAKYSDNMKLLLLSATPMYNTNEEIVWLSNLMNLNDKRPTLKKTDIFNENGEFVKKDKKHSENGEHLLKKRMSGYVSYVRGENPYLFPFRIYPTENNFQDGTYTYPSFQMNGKPIEKENELKNVPVYLNVLNEYQENFYKIVIDNLKKRTGETFDDFGSDKKTFLFENMDTFGYAILQKPLETLNMIYPNEEFDKDEPPNEDEREKLITSMIGKNGLSSIMRYRETSNKQRYDFDYKTQKYGRIFHLDNLHKYSSKISNICEMIKKSEGIILIYSQYIDGGVVPIALALEEMGFTKYSHQSSIKNLLKNKPKEKYKIKVGEKSYNAQYVMITGDKSFSPNNAEDIKYVNNEKNTNGELVKVVIISKAASEGVDFRNIRQVHILEPWYNLNRIEQIIGRGVRNQSHCSLPFEKRNVEIFLHSSILKNNEFETADLYLYRLAEKKSEKIGKVSRILKEISVDCILNEGQHNFIEENMENIVENQNIEIVLSSGRKILYKVGDKPFTSTCDYMDNCNFKCSPMLLIKDDDVIMTTYSEDYIKKNTNTIIQKIRELFREKDVPFFKRDELLVLLKPYSEEEIYYAITHLIENKRELIINKNGMEGNLINNGKYYIFQPTNITDKKTTVYERIIPADVKHDNVIIDITEDILEKNTEIVRTFDIVMEEIAEKFKMVFSEKKYRISPSEINWFKILNFLIEHLQTMHQINMEDLRIFVIRHIIEELGFIDKILLIEKMYNDWTPANIIDTLVKEHFNESLIVSNNGHLGFVLTEDNKTVNIYSQSRNNPNKWEKVGISLFKEFVLSDKYKEKYALNKNKLNNIIGFTSWIEKTKENVFKVRVLNDSSVNKKGKIIMNEYTKNIIKIINDFKKDEIYNFENIKIFRIDNKNKLSVILEILIRKNDLDEIEDKIYYLSNEQMMTNKINSYTR